MKKHLLLVFFLVVLLGFIPSSSSAISIEELQAQIKDLLAKINVLQEQLAQLQARPQWCHDFNTDLKMDMSGNEIAALHIALEKEGFSISSDEKNSQKFAESTASAVSGFQEKYRAEILTPLGLKYPTGFVGKATRAKLNQLYGCAKTCVPEGGSLGPVYPGNTSQCCPGLEPYIEPGMIGTRGICKKPISNQPPVISAVSGPIVLKVNEVGTWIVKASDPENGPLTYTVRWGDAGALQEIKSTYIQTYAQTVTFTHSYSQPGIYTPVFTVTDNQGFSARTSISVNVSAVPTASITVLSPNGGEKWEIGSTQTIKWSSVNAPSGSWVALFLTNGPFIAQGLPTTGSYSWKIPTEYCSGDVCGFPLKSGNDYKIEARLYTGPSLCLGLCPSSTPQPTLLSRDYSDAPFSIVAAPTPIPSITVLSPNGGEKWEIGSTQTIKWSSVNAPSGSWVALFLTNGPFIAQGLPTTGSYSWKIPTEYCSGDVCGFPLKSGNDYKIEARLYTGPSLCLGLCPSSTPQPTLLSRDYSDAPFSIVGWVF